MLIRISNFKESIPNLNAVIHQAVVDVVVNDSVVCRIEIESQGIGQIIIHRILPIKHKIALIECGQSYLTRKQIEFTEFLLVKIPDNVTADWHITRQGIEVKVFQELPVFSHKQTVVLLEGFNGFVVEAVVVCPPKSYTLVHGWLDLKIVVLLFIVRIRKGEILNVVGHWCCLAFLIAIFTHTDKVDALSLGIINGLFFDRIACSRIWRIIQAFLQNDVVKLRIVFRGNQFFLYPVIERQLDAPFFRKKLTQIHIGDNIVLLKIFQTSLVWSLFDWTKTNGTCSSGGTDVRKIRNVGIHVGYSCPPPFVFEFTHAQFIKPHFTTDVSVVFIAQTDHDHANITKTWVPFDSDTQGVWRSDKTWIQFFLTVINHLCWIGCAFVQDFSLDGL